jgi:glycosyltransferase involved in cell wall biosynthesis
MKKILHISKYFYPYYGGIEDVARTIVDELKPYFEQRIICFNHERGTIYNINGVDVLRIGTTCTFASQPISFTYRNKLQKMIDSYKPDFIHLHLPNPLIASYVLTLNLHGAKIITHWHADILGQQYFYPFIRPIEKKILAKSYKIVATSEMYLKSSLPLKNFLDKTVILPNTVNETKLRLYEGEQVEIEKIKEKYQHKKIVFFVGRHVPYKGIEYLIDSEKLIDQDCVIVIAGTGELTAGLKEKVAENSRIKFIGRLSNNELKYYLHASEVFAFPSHNRSEAFGVALAEALYCGLPAVSFNIEGSGALWVNKNNVTGFVVENRNVTEFAKAISKILSSDKLRATMSVNAQEWTKTHFLKDQIIPIMHEIYT